MILVSATTVDLARAQFATTSLYHFLFVPLTLGLGPIVAVFQTLWRRTGDESWLRLTHFFGTLCLINFAIGVATGLVQEFQVLGVLDVWLMRRYAGRDPSTLAGEPGEASPAPAVGY